VVQYLDEVKAKRDRETSVVIQAEINFDQRLRERVSKAKRHHKEDRDFNPLPSKSSRLKGIRHNRKAETERMHQEEAARFCSGNGRILAQPVSAARTQDTPTSGRRSVVPQMPDIAELRKKRMGR
jgi:hypothetical protein